MADDAMGAEEATGDAASTSPHAGGVSGNRQGPGHGTGSSRSPAFTHLRRYGPFYGIAVVALLVLALLPAVGDDDNDDPDREPAASEPVADGDWRPGSGDIEHGTGTTRTGESCQPGDGQLDASVLAAPCLAEFTGDNGGETSRGVTEDTIRLVVRSFPDSANAAALESELEEAGFASQEVSEEIQEHFLDHFNDTYELYGRQVELIEYQSQFGNSTQEAIGQGREGACQDATLIVEELDAFGVISPPGGGVSAVFTECAAERDLFVFAGGANYPESFYEELHPFAWNITMDCEQMAEHAAAYIGTRLLGQPAEFAGDPDLASQTRLFGSYSPDTDQYVSCNDRSRQVLQDDYDAPLTPPVRYTLDISQFADQARRAVIQWKADGVTTVTLAADPISIGYITQAAVDQDYHPEWFIMGSAQSDSNSFGRDYEQAQVDGHMFGLSQISSNDDLYGPNSEPGRLYEELTGEEIAAGTTGNFFALVHVFNFLQASGPELTPDNIASGVQAMPPLGGDGRTTWWFGDTHTATKDAREVFWDGSAPPGPDEDQSLEGAFVETYDGQRFLPDEWPAEAPPVYPDR